MIVQVDQIREGGLVREKALSEEQLAWMLGEADTGFSALSGSRFKVLLQKVGRGVLLQGEFDIRVKGLCKRCLAEVDLALPATFTLNLVPYSAAPSPDGDEEGSPEQDPPHRASVGSFDLAEADEELFDGKTIDLDPIVREQVLLALPMYVVCDERCRGLCGRCGQDLNEKECGCKQGQVDPRLAALKDIKLN